MGTELQTGNQKPPFVFVVIALYLSAGLFVVVAFVQQARDRARRARGVSFWRPRLQVALWALLLTGVLTSFFLGHPAVALVLLLVMGWIPTLRRGPPAVAGP